MDEFIFKQTLEECKSLVETTSYLEILNYSEPLYDVNEEQLLTEENFTDFLHRRGEFASPANLPPNVKLISGLRLIVQQNASQAATFKPKNLSLSHEAYESMVRVMRLPTNHIETTAAIGPFFWHKYSRYSDDLCLQIVHRKSDVRRQDQTRGFELVLTYSFKKRLISGFIKGTPTSHIIRVLQQLRAAPAQVAHPMVLSVTFLRHEISEANDMNQRDTRAWIRRIENFLQRDGDKNEWPRANGYNDTLIVIDGIARDLTDCYSRALIKPPELYSTLTDQMEKTLRQFAKAANLAQGEDAWLAPSDTEADSAEDSVQQLHDSLVSRLEFIRAKLTGLAHYREITLERLKLQRESLYSIIAQRESRLNIEMAKIAYASKRDSTAMKAISLMATLFLPGSYLASIFSMTFFNFQNTESSVSSKIWLYFVIMIPITAALVASWFWFERRRQAKEAESDASMEKNINNMETEIVRSIRRRVATRSLAYKA